MAADRRLGSPPGGSTGSVLCGLQILVVRNTGVPQEQQLNSARPLRSTRKGGRALLTGSESYGEAALLSPDVLHRYAARRGGLSSDVSVNIEQKGSFHMVIDMKAMHGWVGKFLPSAGRHTFCSTLLHSLVGILQSR